MVWRSIFTVILLIGTCAVRADEFQVSVETDLQGLNELRSWCVSNFGQASQTRAKLIELLEKLGRAKRAAKNQAGKKYTPEERAKITEEIGVALQAELVFTRMEEIPREPKEGFQTLESQQHPVDRPLSALSAEYLALQIARRWDAPESFTNEDGSSRIFLFSAFANHQVPLETRTEPNAFYSYSNDLKLNAADSDLISLLSKTGKQEWLVAKLIDARADGIKVKELPRAYEPKASLDDLMLKYFPAAYVLGVEREVKRIEGLLPKLEKCIDCERKVEAGLKEHSQLETTILERQPKPHATPEEAKKLESLRLNYEAHSKAIRGED